MNEELRIKNHESRKRAHILHYSLFILHYPLSIANSSLFTLHSSLFDCSSLFTLHLQRQSYTPRSRPCRHLRTYEDLRRHSRKFEDI